jgi:NAD(P)-dependent dehydrogenase (short-subunit alcohol dehydrogenase family)
VPVSALPNAARPPELLGQSVIVVGGSAGIGLESARRARAEGANILLTARNPERLKQAGMELQADRTEAFDATDSGALRRFFASLSTPVDHVLVTAGSPHYGSFLELPIGEVTKALTEPLLLAIEVARVAIAKVKPGGSLLFIGGTGARRPRRGLGPVSTATIAFPTLVANLALELAPIRVNLIAPGFVDSGLSASILGAGLEERRNVLRSTLPIQRVVKPADVAALAVHLMVNTAITGATYDIDGGQQLLS